MQEMTNYGIDRPEPLKFTGHERDFVSDPASGIAGASARPVSGGGTWLNKGRYLRAGESFTKGKTWFAVRGQWVDRLTGQTAKHIYLWILRNGR